MNLNQTQKIVAFLIAAVALLALPLFAQQFGQGWVRILALALLYVLLALGLNIVVGYAGLLDLGFVAFYAVGAYMYALLASPHLVAFAPPAHLQEIASQLAKHPDIKRVIISKAGEGAQLIQAFPAEIPG